MPDVLEMARRRAADLKQRPNEINEINEKRPRPYLAPNTRQRPGSCSLDQLQRAYEAAGEQLTEVLADVSAAHAAGEQVEHERLLAEVFTPAAEAHEQAREAWVSACQGADGSEHVV